MKNKEWFLTELKSRIAVLDDGEQQDILAEYAQHIDLRVDGGLTEEEAIRDFGDLDQLAAEILEAYHVKPAFGQKTSLPRHRLPDPRPAMRKGCAGAGAWFRRMGGMISGFFRRLWQGTVNGIHKCSCKLRQLFRRKPLKDAAPLPEHHEEVSTVMTSAQAKPHSIRTALCRACNALGKCCRLLARLFWNLMLLLCAVPFALLGLIAVLCLGLLVVLLIQGYPLTGITICCVGTALCCVGTLGLGCGLIWHRQSYAVPSETGSSSSSFGEMPVAPAASSPAAQDAEESEEGVDYYE